MTLRSRFACILMLAVLVSIALPAHAQYTSVTVTKLKSGDGTSLAAGTMCWLGTNNAGQPIGYRAGTDTQSITSPICRDVVNGATTTTYKGASKGALQVADTTLTTPANVCYKVTVVDSSTGKVVLGSYAGSTSGYDCVQPSGATWSFDTYTPAGTPNVVQVAGPQGIEGPAGVTGPQGPAGTTTATGVNGDFFVPGRLYERNVPVRGVKYPGLTSFGDSITCGFLATQGYPLLLAGDTGGTLTNWCRNGDMAADGARQWVYAKTNPGYTRQPTFTYALGINDSTSYGANTDQQQITQTTTYASLAWLAIPSTSKTFGQSGAVTKTGTWTNDDTIQPGIGTQSTVQGSTLSTSIVTTGAPIYIGYRIFDGGTGTASLTIDGTAVTTLNGYGFNHASISTTNGTTDSVALYRYPVTAGTHTLSIAVTSVSGTFSFLWAGTAPSLLAYAGPRVFVGGVTRELADANATLNVLYDGFVRSIVSTLASDGLQVYYVNSRDYLNTSTDLADLKHPNDTGQQHLRDAFAFAMQPSTGSNSAFTTPVTVGAPAEADTNQYSNVNGNSVFSQTSLNPGVLVYRGTNREMGMDLGSESWPNPSLRVFAADNADIKLCHHIGGTALTAHTQFTCNFDYSYNGGLGLLTVSRATVTGVFQFTSGATVGAYTGTFFSPTTAGGAQLGSSSLPWSGLQIGTSSTNRSNLTTQATAARAVSLPDMAGTLAMSISGTTSAIGGASVAAGACVSGTVAVGSAGVTMPVIATTTDGSDVGDAFSIRPRVSSAGTVTVKVCNTSPSAATPPSKAYTVRIIQ